MRVFARETGDNTVLPMGALTSLLCRANSPHRLMVAFFRELMPAALQREANRPFSPELPIRIDRARTQQAAYIKVVQGLGLDIEMLKPATKSPEAVFLRDMAFLLPEVAVVGYPQMASRREEAEELVSVLARYRPMQRIAEPGRLDGGDVLWVDNILYVALSAGTNEEGIAGLMEIVRPFGYEVRTVGLRAGRNLKAACTFVPPHFLVVNPAWVDTAAFKGLTIITVDEAEPSAGNTLTLDKTTLVSASYPKTEQKLRDVGIRTHRVDIREFEKIGGRLARLLLVKMSRPPRPVIDRSLTTVQVLDAPAPIGHAAQAIVHDGLVYISAQFPFTSSAVKPPQMPFERQTEHVLRNVATVLSSAGSSLDNVLHVTVHLANPKHLGRMEAIYARVFSGHRPTRSVISNQALPPGALIAIEVVAAVARGRHS